MTSAGGLTKSKSNTVDETMPHETVSTSPKYYQGEPNGPIMRPDDLGPVFCAWQDVGKGKPPLNPCTGRMASVTDLTTWGTKAQAEAWRDRLGDAASKGVGTMLHPLPDRPDWALAGVDLDGCRDPETGALAWWAEAVVERLGGYVEPSPSGTGLHVLFFVRLADVDALRAVGLIRPDPSTGKPGAGRSFALSGDHREIAFFAARKFLTLTERPLSGHDLIRPVGFAALEWLLGKHGPAVQAREGAKGSRSVGRDGGTGRDESGSGHAWDFCLSAFRSGANEDAVIKAIAEDGDDAGDWWARTDDRQQERVVERTKATVEAERQKLLEDYNMLDLTDDDELSPEHLEVIWEPSSGAEGGSPSRDLASVAETPLRTSEREAADRQAPYSDTWAGARHADRWRGKRLYVSATGQWLEWTGQRWAAQTVEDVMADAKKTSTELYAHAAATCAANPSDDNQKRLRMAAKLHGSSAALIRMEESARSEPRMHVASPAEFDRDPCVLATVSGLVDLKSGALRPARPEDMVSKLAGCTYDPDAPAPMWEAMMARALPDPEVRSFLQRAVGYSITGHTGEEAFFLTYGGGANSKSVIANVLRKMLGEYAGQFGAALVMKGKNDNEGERMKAGLPGLRLAQVDETATGDVFDGARTKTLSGREPIAARLLHHEVFAFEPTHKLWIRTNHLPGSQDPSDGFWRRCIPIPFTVQIPEEERIPDLDQRIVAQELPGVLAWAVRGAVEWARGGLRVPASIKAVKAQYREDTDLLGQWLADRTIPDPEGDVRAGVAYNDYKAFCDAQGVKCPSQPVFGRELVAQDIKRGTNTARRSYLGFRLRPYVDEAFPDVI